MTPIEEIIPLYLADRISLDSAVQYASQTPRNTLLLTTLKESRSLPRSIDTDPTTPTPDLPSPSQDKLLQLIRALDSRARAQDRDSGIALDDLISIPGYGSEAEEQYNALHVFTNEAVRDFAAYSLHAGSIPSSASSRKQSQSHGRNKRSIRSSLFRARSDSRYLDSDVNADVGIDADAEVDTFADEHADPGADVPISSGSDLGHRRRRSSGVEKHLYNLISFLTFLTKEKLLLYPNVGERVAVEMVSETLYHPPSHSHLHSHSHSHSYSNPQSQSQPQPQSWNRTRNRSHSVPQSAGFDSKENVKGKGREETVAVAGSHEPWFGFVSATGPGNEVCVTAVALWLIIMGEELYQRARMERRERRARLKTMSKEGEEDVWTRLSEVVGREWQTWTGRLQFLSLREDLDISAREHAAEAAAVMRRVYNYD